MRDDDPVVDEKLPVDPDVDLDRERRPPRRRRRRARHGDVLAVIALGGGLGSLARYGLEAVVPARPDGFPLGTFAINVSGSLALGFLMVYLLEVWSPRRYLRPFLAVGFLGGYTTFSTFAAEIRDLVARSSWFVADSYALDSVLVGLAAVWVGVVLGRLAAGLPVRRGGRRTHPPVPARRGGR
jgi:fluoride exporter